MSESVRKGLLDSAKQLRINTNEFIVNNTLFDSEANDLYSFNLKGRSSFNLSLDGLSADADVKLFQDKNANEKFDKGERILYSNNGGNLAESISTDLAAGDYYIEVYSYDKIETNYRLTTSAAPFDSAGNSLNNARQIAVDSQTKSISDWVGKADSQDYYRFNIAKTSDFQVVVDGLSADADLRLLSGKGNILRSSLRSGTSSESITQTLEAGDYYLKLFSYNDSETYYNLKISASPTPEIISDYSDNTQPIPTSASDTGANSRANQSGANANSATPQSAGNTRSQAGTLRADTFTFQSGYSRTIFSGNGNVDYGSGARDLIDLSGFASTSVTLNYANSPNCVHHNSQERITLTPNFI